MKTLGLTGLVLVICIGGVGAADGDDKGEPKLSSAYTACVDRSVGADFQLAACSNAEREHQQTR